MNKILQLQVDVINTASAHLAGEMWNKTDTRQFSTVTLLSLVSLQRTYWSTPTEKRQFLRWPIKHSQEVLRSLGIPMFSKKAFLLPTTIQSSVFKQWVIFHRKNQYKTVCYQLLLSSAPFFSGNFSDTGVRRKFRKDDFRRHWNLPETKKLTQLKLTDMEIYYVENCLVSNAVSQEHGIHSDEKWCL
jgi:hypothetical protein